MEHTPGPWKPDGKHMLITQLVEGHPTRKRFYGIEGKIGNYRDTIAYFTNEADRDLCLALPDLLAACEAARDWLNAFGEHAPIQFGGEAELAEQLDAAIARTRARGEDVK